MLVALGFLMVAVFMFLIMSKRATPAVGLIAVPVVFGLLAGAGLGIGDMVAGGMKSVAPTAALLFFAIIFFGIMIDVGLFNPLVRLILRIVGGDPMRLVLGNAVLAMVVSLDGDGSTTFIIVTSALLPLYLKLKVSPVVLTVVAGLSNGAMNIGIVDSKFARVRLVVVIGSSFRKWCQTTSYAIAWASAQAL